MTVKSGSSFVGIEKAAPTSVRLNLGEFGNCRNGRSENRLGRYIFFSLAFIGRAFSKLIVLDEK